MSVPLRTASSKPIREKRLNKKKPMYWNEPYIENEGMTTDERIRHGCLSGASLVVAMIITLVICALIGCKSVKYIKVPDIRTDTLYINKTQRDSIWLHDSVNVVEKQIGDTVYLLHDRWHTKYVESIKHDTLYQSRVDSVGVPYPVEVYIDKPLSKWQQMRLHFGNIFIIIIGVLGIIAIIKLKTKIWP